MISGQKLSQISEKTFSSENFLARLLGKVIKPARNSAKPCKNHAIVKNIKRYWYFRNIRPFLEIHSLCQNGKKYSYSENCWSEHILRITPLLNKAYSPAHHKLRNKNKS